MNIQTAIAYSVGGYLGYSLAFVQIRHTYPTAADTTGRRIKLIVLVKMRLLRFRLHPCVVANESYLFVPHKEWNSCYIHLLLDELR